MKLIISRLLFCLILFPEPLFPSGPFLEAEIREDTTRRKNTRDQCQYVEGSKKEKAINYYRLQVIQAQIERLCWLSILLGHGGKRGKIPLTFNLKTRRRWVDSFTPRLFYLGKKKPRHGQRNLSSTGENRFSDNSSGWKNST